MSKVPLAERVWAETGAFVTRHPVLRAVIAGPRPARVTWIDFFVARTTVGELQMPIFRGGPVAGRNRGTWPIGSLIVYGEQLTAALDEPENKGAVRAVVWKAGRTALLVGAVPPEHLSRWEGDIEVGAAVGPHDHGWAPALWRPDNTVVLQQGGFTVVALQDELGRFLPQYENADATPPDTLNY